MSHCPGNITQLENADISEQPLWSNGLTFHHLGEILAAAFGVTSIAISLFLVFQHATHYLKPWEQKHIIRILLMIPIYSAVSFLSFHYYKHAVYFQVLRDCYEAFAIASFFTLLCHYIAPNLHEQKVYFRALTPKNWFWGVFFLQKCTGGQDRGPFRRPRSGLTWFNVVWVGVFQYCCIRITFTIVSVLTEAMGRYCEHSLSPAYGHIWVLAFESASVTTAMFCLIQFYIQLREDLAEHRPFLKVLCVKLVIFFSFWQTLVISFLASSSGPLRPTPKLNYPDIFVGIPSVLLCTEMAIFAVMHLFAFPWKAYSIEHSYKDPLHASGSGFSGEAPRYKGGPLGILAFLDAFNPWDIVKASARGFRWLFVGVRKRHEDSSYQGQGTKVGSAAAGFEGPVYAGTGEAATELRSNTHPVSGRGRVDTLATDVTGLEEDDRAGLLRHQQSMAGGTNSASPYRPYEGVNDEYTRGDDSRLDVGARTRTQRARLQPSQLDGKPSDFAPSPYDEEDEDLSYHGVSSPPRSGAVHPALRRPDLHAGLVDHWRPDGDGDADSVRPPTYRSRDAQG